MSPEASSMRVPITVYDLAFWMPVEVGEVRIMAQLDTGSADMNVTEGFSANFADVGPTSIRGAFRQMKTRSVRLPPLKWLGKLRPDLVARVRPDFDEGLPFQAGVTLGNSVLLAQPLYLDFVRIQIGIEPLDGYRYVLKVPLQEKHGLPFLELTLGDKKLTAAFDLGAGVSVLNERISFSGQEMILSDEGEDSTRESRRFSLYRGPPISLDGHLLCQSEYATIELKEIEDRLGSPIEFILGANTLLRIGGIWKLDLQGGYAEWG